METAIYSLIYFVAFLYILSFGAILYDSGYKKLSMKNMLWSPVLLGGIMLKHYKKYLKTKAVLKTEHSMQIHFDNSVGTKLSDCLFISSERLEELQGKLVAIVANSMGKPLTTVELYAAISLECKHPNELAMMIHVIASHEQLIKRTPFAKLSGL